MLIPLGHAALLYGAAIASAALLLLRFRCGQSWRRTLFVAGCIFLYLLLVAPVLAPLRGFTTWLAPVAEELLKLAIVSRLRLWRQGPVLVCLAFAGIEVMDKALPFLFVLPMPAPQAVLWLALFTTPVLMHAATGVLYAHREGRVGAIFTTCVLLHALHNIVVPSFVAPDAFAASALFVLTLGMAELLIVIGVTGWMQDRADERRRVSGVQTLAGDPPIV